MNSYFHLKTTLSCLLSPTRQTLNSLFAKTVSLGITIVVIWGILSLLYQFYDALLNLPHDQPRFLFWATLNTGLNFLLLAGLNTALFCLYKLKLPVIQAYKVMGDKPWPWQSDPVAWQAQLKRTLRTLAINLVIIFSMTYGDLLLANALPVNFFKDEFPTVWRVLWQVTFFAIVQDFCFYWGHRVLHSERFYWIHKQHHQYSNSVGLAAEYCHPLEFMITNLLPFGMGPKILGAGQVHMATYLCWIVLKMIETTEAHSGYDFGVGVLRYFPFSGSSAYHNFHHSHNVGNYGVLTLWDTICGTNKEFMKKIAEGKTQ